jgi:hypothetical protein
MTATQAVESLYREERLIASCNLRVAEEEIACFVPADDAFDPEQWFNPAHDALFFAVTPFGDRFFVRPSEVAKDLAVYLQYHDGAECVFDRRDLA